MAELVSIAVTNEDNHPTPVVKAQIKCTVMWRFYCQLFEIVIRHAWMTYPKVTLKNRISMSMSWIAVVNIIMSDLEPRRKPLAPFLQRAITTSLCRCEIWNILDKLHEMFWVNSSFLASSILPIHLAYFIKVHKKISSTTTNSSSNNADDNNKQNNAINITVSSPFNNVNLDRRLATQAESSVCSRMQYNPYDRQDKRREVLNVVHTGRQEALREKRSERCANLSISQERQSGESRLFPVRKPCLLMGPRENNFQESLWRCNGIEKRSSQGRICLARIS